MIAIVNYGLGNIKAFANVYKSLNIPFKIVSCSADFNDVTKIILPGVGAFDQAMEHLQASGMREVLDELVLCRKLPVLGICVGMQIMACSSEEGELPGLGWIDGVVKKFDIVSSHFLPHMGWNTVNPLQDGPLFEGISDGARFYFLHSYYFQCHNENNILAVTEYGARFACVIRSGNIRGVQFHPEKSHQNGVQLLKNFGNL